MSKGIGASTAKRPFGPIDKQVQIQVRTTWLRATGWILLTEGYGGKNVSWATIDPPTHLLLSVPGVCTLSGPSFP